MKIKASRYYLLAFFVYKKVVHLLNNINSLEESIASIDDEKNLLKNKNEEKE